MRKMESSFSAVHHGPGLIEYNIFSRTDSLHCSPRNPFRSTPEPVPEMQGTGVCLFCRVNAGAGAFLLFLTLSPSVSYMEGQSTWNKMQVN